MKKISRIVSVLMIAVMMMTCVGAVTTANVSAATTSQQSTKVATKTTTKTTNKTVKMKKKAKKSKVQTKKQTKTKTKTTNSSSKKVVVKTTTQTITKTTFKKKSKIKKIKTTVKTTVKTTTTIKDTTTAASENTSVNNTAAATENKESTVTENSKVSASIEDIRKAVPSDLLNAFDELGFTITINSSVSYQGVFSTKRHLIELRSASSGVLLHEMGHFLAILKNNVDKTDEWKAIYADEKSSYTGSNKAYVTSTCSEYFAESYRDYVEKPSTLKKERPNTYAYVKEAAKNITQDDIDRTYRMYGWAW